MPWLLGAVCSGAIACQAVSRSPATPTAVSVALGIVAHEETSIYDFRGTFRDRAAVSMDSAHVAVLDYPNKRVVVVDTAGWVVNTFGREGAGPGEFRNPERLVRTDTALYVYDGVKGALVGFTLKGAPLGDVLTQELFGPLPTGFRYTGFTALRDGSWVYSTVELGPDGMREGLYRRIHETTHLLAATPVASPTILLMPCGVSIRGDPPVFTPTLRWAANGTGIAFTTWAEDRLVRLDITTGDSVVVEGTARPQPASRKAALAATRGYSVTTPTSRCELTPEQVLAQQGMMETMPVIDRIALSRGGDLWVRLSAVPGDSAVIIIQGRTRIDSLLGGGFPGLFLTESLYVVESRDAEDSRILSLWELKPFPVMR